MEFFKSTQEDLDSEQVEKLLLCQKKQKKIPRSTFNQSIIKLF